MVRHGAQVFADHDHPVAHTLEGEDADEVLIAVTHVGSGVSFHAVGDPVKAEKTHHVIDAQRAAMLAGPPY